jgi:hypothetical protein
VCRPERRGATPKGSVPGDPYCFDKDIKFYSSDKAESTRFADFYKEGHFLIEAKQGSQDTSKGHGKRGTKDLPRHHAKGV